MSCDICLMSKVHSRQTKGKARNKTRLLTISMVSFTPGDETCFLFGKGLLHYEQTFKGPSCWEKAKMFPDVFVMWIHHCLATPLPSITAFAFGQCEWHLKLFEYYTLAVGHKEWMTSRIRRTTSSRMWCSSGRGDMYWKKSLISSWSLQK